MTPINNELTRLIDKMHTTILDTEASGRPAGNLYDVWWALKTKLESELVASETTREEIRPVLTYCGLLVPDNSPLLNDAEWVKEAVDAVSDDDHDQGRPLLRLSLDTPLTGKAALDYVLARRERAEGTRS